MSDKKTCTQCAYFVMRGLYPITEENIKSEKAMLKHMKKVIRTCPELNRDNGNTTRCFEPDSYPCTTREQIKELEQRIEQYEKEHPHKTFSQWVKGIMDKFSIYKECHLCEYFIERGTVEITETNVQYEKGMVRIVRRNLIKNCPYLNKKKHLTKGYRNGCSTLALGLMGIIAQKIYEYEEKPVYEKAPQWAKNVMNKFMKVV